jgi:hypothetical protein
MSIEHLEEGSLYMQGVPGLAAGMLAEHETFLT